MTGRLALATCVLVGGVLARPAHAQVIEDERAWFVGFVQKRATPEVPWGGSMEVILRSRDGLQTLDVLSLRPTLIRYLTSRSTVGAGYAASRSFPASGGSSLEQRWFGQFVWVGGVAGGSLTLRTRVEARLLEGNDGPLGRMRQQVRYSRPLGSSRRLALLLTDEFFVHLNNTVRAARGIDQNRTAGGLLITAGPRARVEVTYLNQFSPGHRGAPDRRNHILSSALIVTY
jgi:hypothetical protein